MGYKTIAIPTIDHGAIGESDSFSMLCITGDDYKVKCEMPVKVKEAGDALPLNLFQGTVTIGAVKAREFISSDIVDRYVAFNYILNQFLTQYCNYTGAPIVINA